MKKIIQYLYRIIIATILISLNGIDYVFAQKDASQLVKEVQHEKSLLWKISGNGLKSPSYLFGTMHLICEDKYLWTESMKAALENSNELILEMDLNDPKMQIELAKNMMLPQGQKLSDYFSESEFEKFKSFAQVHLKQYPMMVLEKMKPSAIMTMLSSTAFTCSETRSYEMELMKYASQNQLKVRGLETIEDQIKALDAGDSTSIINYIVEVVNSNGKNGQEEIIIMMEKYSQQDISGMEKIISQSDNAAMNTITLLKNRNENWIKLLKEWLPENALFIAVGAAHLSGPNGVIELLKKEGYTVEAVR